MQLYFYHKKLINLLGHAQDIKLSDKKENPKR